MQPMQAAQGSTSAAPTTAPLATISQALDRIASAAREAATAKKRVGAPGDYGYGTPAGQAVSKAITALAELIWEVESNLEIVEETLPCLVPAQTGAGQAAATMVAQIRAAIAAPRYPGTPMTPDEARTDSEKELVSILEGIGAIIDSMEDTGPIPSPSLTFAALRAANIARLPTFKNAKGEPAHSEADGSDWALSAWSNAVLGELGEAANIIKKVERGDMTLDEARPSLAKEFADVQTYLDILAFRADVDLGQATITKFNEVSVRVGSPVRLAESTFFLDMDKGH